MREAVLLALMVFASVCRGQFYSEPAVEVVQTIETLPWSEVATNEFEYHGEGFLIDHLRGHPMLGNELEKLHEWLHQRVERLRPSNVHAFIVVEATEAEFQSWPDRVAIENAGGWTIIRQQPVRNGIKNVVAIGKEHFSHAGYLTSAALTKFVNQVKNRKFKPIKSAKAKFVKTLKVFTRKNCSWCDKWMASEYPQALAEGVSVEFITDENGTVPRFEICDESGQCRQYTGFTLWSKIKGNG